MGLSDRSDCAADLTVMHLEEILADKLTCLLQRQSIRDLFDLTHSTRVQR
ncbi:nucleotidyl transferase AbiEii/AbiGii toxin family protein [Streptomyces rubiginosohelvolus]|nr:MULTISPECIES: nucleotidyl transferase AbiEii/AbiGii toxin family protein [Streptomyces]MCA1271752.1 nucleotidyl transferase AbiEii/AbiGii toxin family protein [Streptomyces sp. 7G]